MAEPKPMASLSSTLLARKGQAKPAMRPQGFASFGFGAPQSQEDLGWNDMGHDLTVEHVKREHGLGAAAEPASPQPVVQTADIVPITKAHAEPQPVVAPPAVIRQQEDLARDLAPVVRIPPRRTGFEG